MAGSEYYLDIVACASGLGGVDERCGNGPLLIKDSKDLKQLAHQGFHFCWDRIISPDPKYATEKIEERVAQVNRQLAMAVSELLSQQKFVTVLGGDHSCAVGTWSGMYDFFCKQKSGEMGLIWVDAHMDSHTPETSLSGRIHGMPLAALMGYGYPTLTSILHDEPKFHPQHVCLIGVRSYEAGEAALLKRLGVKVYFMEEVKQKGLPAVLCEATERMRASVAMYGLSIDIDGLDPLEAPGVDVPEPDGLKLNELLQGLTMCIEEKKLKAIEIVEFNPARDQQQITEKVVIALLGVIARGRGQRFSQERL